MSGDVSCNCSSLPLQSWEVDAFATAQERQKNPSQKDISTFFISSLKNFSEIAGFVSLPVNTSAVLANVYNFTGRCQPKIFNAFCELVLHISAQPESLVNNCSVIYNMHKNGSYFGSAGYIGSPSLITGDPDFNFCQGQRYGTLIPKSASQNFSLID